MVSGSHPFAVTYAKPALKIDAPNLVWGSDVVEWLNRRRYPSPYPLRPNQTSSIEDLTDGARRRPSVSRYRCPSRVRNLRGPHLGCLFRTANTAARYIASCPV